MGDNYIVLIIFMQKYLYVLVPKELCYRLIQISETYLEPLTANNAKFITRNKNTWTE